MDKNNQEKLKALDVALTQIEKAYGKGAVMKLGDSGANMNIEVVPTGSLSLDIALGLGGLPKGRIIEIYGPESSGKTTVALHAVAEVQKRGGIAGFIDAEHALDPVYARNIGVDIDNLYISQPDNGQQALEITGFSPAFQNKLGNRRRKKILKRHRPVGVMKITAYGAVTAAMAKQIP